MFEIEKNAKAKSKYGEWSVIVPLLRRSKNMELWDAKKNA